MWPIHRLVTSPPIAKSESTTLKSKSEPKPEQLIGLCSVLRPQTQIRRVNLFRRFYSNKHKMTGSPKNVLITYIKISHTDSLRQNKEHWTIYLVQHLQFQKHEFMQKFGTYIALFRNSTMPPWLKTLPLVHLKSDIANVCCTVGISLSCHVALLRTISNRIRVKVTIQVT